MSPRTAWWAAGRLVSRLTGWGRESLGVFRYIKSAFLWPWNLLAFGGAVGFALLSGRPDVALPIVLAGEAAFLGLLGTHPKFQRAIDRDAWLAEQGRQRGQDTEQALNRILAALPRASVQRFESLRQRCQDLRHIALGLTDPRQTDEAPPLEGLQVAGLDRLLWTYLRLLYTQHMLNSFMERTDATQIQRTITNLEQALKGQSLGDDDPQKQRIRKALEDNLQTSRERLANLDKARSNLELVQLEIDRLENKIQSLSELAINRQEPSWVAGQIDQVASSMVQTERTMNDLQFATGLPEDEEVPALVQRETLKTR